MSSFGGANTARFGALLPLGLVLFALPLACDAGGIQLLTTLSEPQEPATGGHVGSGGLVEVPPPATGGRVENEGGAGPMRPDDQPEDTPKPLPCLVTGACFAFCTGDRPGCTECARDSECPFVVPRCDRSIDRCVECLDDRDCETVFGSAFGECSLGMCVQCQRDDQCPFGDRCDNGWCGHCEGDWDCPQGMDCFRDHCVPSEP